MLYIWRSLIIVRREYTLLNLCASAVNAFDMLTYC
jgi:hypothetical protein